MIARFTILLAVLLLSACAQQMTKQDFEQINNVAVVNCIKNEMTYFNRGLTIFGNSSNTVNITDWKLSEYIADTTITTGKNKNPTVAFTNVPIDLSTLDQYRNPSANYLEQLKAQGYDTVLIINNAGIYTAMGGGSYIAPPQAGGFIFYTTSFMGNKFRNQLFPQFAYRLKRLSDSKDLSYASNSMKYPKEIETITAKPFDQYTAPEKEIIKQEFIKNIDATLDESLTKLFTVQTAQ